MSDCTALILPGVGAFGDCMVHLGSHGFVGPVKAWISADRPFLGICLGLQVLVEGSDESPDVPGLGVLPGRVVRFPADPARKVPQIGWNAVRQVQAECPLFDGIDDESYFYFVHSYYVETPESSVVAGITAYGADYTSCIRRGNLMAVQFHPEKSQQKGLQLLRNFNAACLKSA
jgi:glutamine amidotransferase